MTDDDSGLKIASTDEARPVVKELRYLDTEGLQAWRSGWFAWRSGEDYAYASRVSEGRCSEIYIGLVVASYESMGFIGYSGWQMLRVDPARSSVDLLLDMEQFGAWELFSSASYGEKFELDDFWDEDGECLAIAHLFSAIASLLGPSLAQPLKAGVAHEIGGSAEDPDPDQLWRPVVAPED